MKTLGKRIWLLPALLAVLLFCGCTSADISGSYEQGLEALENGKADLALSCFQDAVKYGHKASQAYRGEGLVYLQWEQYEKAEECFDRALEELADTSANRAFKEDIMLYKAEACHKAGHTESARSVYSELLDGQNAGRAYLLRGELYLEKDSYEDAANDFRMALQKDSSYENYIRIYEAYSAKNRAGDGAVYLKQALDNEPANAEDYAAYGKICYYLGQTEQAKEYLSRAIEYGDGESFVRLGEICIDTGDIPGARAIYEKNIDSDYAAAAYNGLALCDMADGEYDSALEKLEAGLALQDGSMDEDLKLNRIAAYERKMDFSKAESLLDAFLKEYPNNADAQREKQFLSTR